MTTSATALRQKLGALFFAVLLFGGVPVSASAVEKPRPDEAPRGAVLTGKAALDLGWILCSESNGGSPTLWQPGPADIARLEKLLPAFMARQKTPEDYQPLHEYYRQYVGIVRDGKKRICVNLFHYSFVQATLRLTQLDPVIRKPVQGGQAEDFWKQEPVVVDDGGAYFFRVQFNVEPGSFDSLGFNGYA